MKKEKKRLKLRVSLSHVQIKMPHLPAQILGSKNYYFIVSCKQVKRLSFPSKFETMSLFQPSCYLRCLVSLKE